jgi:hypothetical protein
MFTARSPMPVEMSQGLPDGHARRTNDDGSRERREHRLTVLARASAAVRRAHAASEDAGKTRAVAEEVRMMMIENLALLEAEREAMRGLELDVRRFADRLRIEGTPPEIAVRQLKATVEPVVFSSREQQAGDVEWRRAVAGDVVRWFVEAFYAA